MSFKKVLLEETTKSIPDFIFDSQKSTNMEFLFYKEENQLRYEVWFQIARNFPEFVVELVVVDNKPSKYPELNKNIRKRLGHLAYGKDYWWQYEKNDKNTINQAINNALEMYNLHAASFFAKSSKQILAGVA